MISLDWAFTGPGAVGNDLGELVGNSMYFFDYDPYDVETLEATLLESYLAGIADNRAEIDPPFRRGARAVEWDGLENRCGARPHRGFVSPPSPQVVRTS